MSDYMKGLVLCESKAVAKLGPEPSSSCYCSRLNFGPFKCFLKGHFLLFVVCGIKSPRSPKFRSCFCTTEESFFQTVLHTRAELESQILFAVFLQKTATKRTDTEIQTEGKKMAPKYKETLVDRSYSQQVFMEELRWRVKPPCKAQTKGSVFSCASSPIFGGFVFFFCQLSPLKET